MRLPRVYFVAMTTKVKYGVRVAWHIAHAPATYSTTACAFISTHGAGGSIVLGVCSAVMSIVYNRLLKFVPRLVIVLLNFGMALTTTMLLRSLCSSGREDRASGVWLMPCGKPFQQVSSLFYCLYLSS